MVRRFVLQWHLSETCNLKCKHCYQEKLTNQQLNYNQLLEILDQYKELLKVKKMRGHINVTGGEPLCNPHFFELLKTFKKDADLYTFSILTNGTLVTEAIAKKIKSFNPQYVQVSLDGTRRVNDALRGKGTYKRIIQGIDNLVAQKIFTSISFTAMNHNYRDFKKVVAVAKKHKVNSIWSDRFIPIGPADINLCMNYRQSQKYFKTIAQVRQKAKEQGSLTNISANRALQFLMTNEFAYECTAGISLLTIMENGDLVPCRRMPIVLENVFKMPIKKIMATSQIIKELNLKKIPKECLGCEHAKICRGGLKCLSYARYGKLDYRDDACSYHFDL